MTAVAVLGVVAVAYFAVSALTGGAGGGASNPEAAVRALADAVDGEDAAAAINSIAPDEIGSLGDVIGTTTSRLRKAGLVKGNLLAGLRLDLTGVDLRVRALGDDMARVEIRRATLQYRLEPGAVTDRARPALVGISNSDRSGTIHAGDAVVRVYNDSGDEEEITPFLIAVKQGGRWYVSPLHTIAEYLIDGNGLPSGTHNTSARAANGSRPDGVEESISALAEAVGSGDVDEAAALLVDGQGQLLTTYRSAIARILRDAGFDANVSVDQVDYREEKLAHGRRKIIIESLAGTTSVTADGDTRDYDIDFDGKCLRIREPSVDSTKTCLTSNVSDQTGIDQAFLVMVRDGGTYKLDIAATITEYLRILVDHVDENVALGAFGLQKLGTPGSAVTIGHPVTGKTNAGAFAVHTFTGKAGQRVGVDATEGTATGSGAGILSQMYDPAGKPLTSKLSTYYPGCDNCLARLTADPACSNCLFELPVDGTYRIVVRAWQDNPFKYRLAVGNVTSANTTAPGSLTGDVQPGDITAIKVDVRGRDRFKVGDSSEEDFGWTVRDSSDEDVDCATTGSDDTRDSCSLSGTTIYVYGMGTGGHFNIPIVEAPSLSFDGHGATVQGSTPTASGTSATYQLNVDTSSAVVITVSPTTPDLDVVLVVNDLNGSPYTADRGYGGGPETLTISAGNPGTYQITVRSYGTTSGGFTLTASEQV